MTGPLTVMMAERKVSGSTILFPLLMFVIAKLIGELRFACTSIPFLAIIIIAEILRDVSGNEGLLSIRVSASVVMLSMAMWNNGFYFGGKSYLEAAVADMGEEYIRVTLNLSTPTTYAAVIFGVIIASCLSERITEKIMKIK